MGFNRCKNLGHCGEDLCIPEFCHKYDPIVPTNADRIRAMSDEELEDFLFAEEWMCVTYKSCSVCPLRGEKRCMSILEWLKQPTEVDNG